MEEQEQEGLVKGLEAAVVELKEIEGSLKEGGSPWKEIRARVRGVRQSINALRGCVAAKATDDAIIEHFGEANFLRWKKDSLAKWAEENAEDGKA